MSVASRTFFVHLFTMSEIERVQFKLMLPVHMKAALEEAAHDNRRSLSAEIIHRLYTTLDMDEYEPSENVNTDPEHVDISDPVAAMKVLAKMAKEWGVSITIEENSGAKDG